MLNPWIMSEIHPLTHVLLAKPSKGLHYLTKNNYKQYLFNELPNINVIFSEHDAFINLLKSNGIEPFFVDDLLCESLENPEARRWILNQLMPTKVVGRLHDFIRDTLLSLDSSTLADYLINGVNFSEISKQGFIPKIDIDGFLFHPLPNNYFTRDTSMWLHDGVIIGAMKHTLRRREALIMSCIYRYCSIFNRIGLDKIWFDGSHSHNNEIYLEGGDLMLIDKDTLLIGHSQRKNYNAIHKLISILFEKTELQQIIVPELPNERSCVHLDMVLSMVNQNSYSISRTLLDRIRCVWTISKCEGTSKIEVKRCSNLVNVLQARLNNEINIIALDDEKIEHNEQKECANNLLTIRPGLVVSYEHNHHTNSLLTRSGIKVITILSSQLHLGNGGLHCMSCPIVREDKLII